MRTWVSAMLPDESLTVNTVTRMRVPFGSAAPEPFTITG